MNCQICKDNLIGYLEGALSSNETRIIRTHLENCDSCRQQYKELYLSYKTLKASLRAETSASFADGVMLKIQQRKTRQESRTQMGNTFTNLRLRILTLTGASLAACVLIVAVIIASQSQCASAAEIMARASSLAINLKSVHISGKMRTLPNDNFSLILPELEPVPIDLWRKFDDKLLYRVEKPGRFLSCDGNQQTLLITATNPPFCYQVGPGRGFDAGWLVDMTDLCDFLQSQIDLSNKYPDKLNVSQTEIDGKVKHVVSIHLNKGLEDDYLHNRFISTSNSIRRLCFDDESGLLESLSISIINDQQEIIIYETNVIEYDLDIPAETFAPELPENTCFMQELQILPDNEKYEKLTAMEAATVFLTACNKYDWQEAQKFLGYRIDDDLKDYIGGVELISLGKGFSSKLLPGEHSLIPYTIKLKNGDTKSHNLAVRKYPKTKRWFIDGGL